MVLSQTYLRDPSLESLNGVLSPQGNPGAARLQNHRRILVQFIGAHDEAGAAFQNAYRLNPGNLSQVFSDLSPRHQSQLRENLSRPVLQNIFSLSREGNTQIFSRDFLHLGKSLESRNNHASGSLLYQLAAATPQLESIHSQANRRIQILQGNGNFGEHLQFLSTQFIDQIADPGLFLGMLTAGWAFRNVSSGALQLLGRRSFGNRALAWVAGFGAEVPAFTLTVRGMHEFQGHTQDWSSQALRDDLSRTALMLLFLKSSAAVGNQAVANLARGNAASSLLTRFSARAIPQATMYTGLLGAHAAEQYLGLRQPSDHPLLDSLVTLLHFNIAGKILNHFTPQVPANTLQGRPPVERLVERLVRQWQASEFLSGNKNQAVSPGGIRIRIPNPNMQMAINDGDARPSDPAVTTQETGQRGSPPTRGPRQEFDPALGPLKFKPKLFTEIRDRLQDAGAGFAEMREEYEGNPLWLRPSRAYALQIRALLEMTQKALEDHPYRQDYKPILDRSIQELDHVNGMLYSTPRNIPSSQNNQHAKVFLGEMWRSTNGVVGFIYATNPMGLTGALEAIQLARSSLGQILGIKGSPLSPSQTRRLLADRRLFDPENGQFDKLVSTYQWTNNPNLDVKDIPTSGNRVLAIGDTSTLRKSVQAEQHSVVIPRRATLGRSPEEILSVIQKAAADNPAVSEQSSGFDYLEINNPVQIPGRGHDGGEAFLKTVVSTLRPGGVGYLVHRDPVAFRQAIDILTQNQIADILWGATEAPPAVETFGTPTATSNFLFFRKLPFR